jgi:hypothetical protein
MQNLQKMRKCSSLVEKRQKILKQAKMQNMQRCENAVLSFRIKHQKILKQAKMQKMQKCSAQASEKYEKMQNFSHIMQKHTKS